MAREMHGVFKGICRNRAGPAAGGVPVRGMSLLRDLYISRGPAAAFAAVGVYWGTFAALVPVLKPQVGLSDGEFGLAMLVSAAGAIMAMWLAPLAEQALKTRALTILTALLAMATLLPGQMHSGIPFALALLAVTMATGTLVNLTLLLDG